MANKNFMLMASLCMLVNSAVIADEAPAQQPAQVMVVVDASGSMWGQIDGKTKIELVQTAYRQLILDWQSLPIETGLIVYGHRRKSDCQDIELLAKPARDNAEQLIDAVDNVRPLGKTPLAASVQLAADQLDYQNEKATVILLSDGRETCDLDPCTVAAELEEKGIDFTAHVIGLDIKTASDKQQLQCLAHATGGKYIDANNAEELSQAFNTNRDSIQQDINTQAKTKLEVHASTTDLAQRIDKIEWNLTVSGQEYRNQTASSSIDLTDWLEQNLVNGTHTLTASSGPYSGTLIFDYPNKSEVLYLSLTREVPKSSVAVMGEVSAGSEFEVEWVGHGGATDVIAVVPLGGEFNDHLGQAPVQTSSRLTLRAPAKPGDYELLYVFDAYGKGRVDVRSPLRVLPASIEVSPIGAVHAGTPFTVNWQGPAADGDIIAIGPRTGLSDDHVSVNWVSEGNPLTLTAPESPGDYELRYYNDDYEILFVNQVLVLP